MRIIVVHGLDDLASDMRRIPVKAQRGMAKVVRTNAKEGNMLARRMARAKAGKHGKNYFKRLTAEMVTPLSWEYGPEGDPKSDFVGVGFRHGVNLDLPNSADVIGPKFADDVGDMADGLFW